MKIAAFFAVALSLSACVGSGDASSAQIVNNGLACPGSPHMATTGNLPVRCGPQAVSPYTFQ